MKQLLVLIMLATSVMGLTSSCTSEPETPVTKKVKAKLKYVYHPNSAYEIRYIDPMFSIGDRVKLGAFDFYIVAIDSSGLK